MESIPRIKYQVVYELDLHKGDSRGWTQWMQWNSGIWWWGHCLWCKKVKTVDAVDAKNSDMHTGDAVNSEYYVPTTIYHYSTAYTASIGLTLFVPKTLSPSPYTTIQLCPLHTASTASTVSTTLPTLPA